MNPNRFLVPVLLGFVLIAASSRTARAQATWFPMVVNKSDTLIIDDDGKSLNDKEWAKISYADYKGFKPRLGVVYAQEKHQDQSQYHNEWARLFVDMSGRGSRQTGTDPFNHIEEIVNQALIDTHRFTMLERTNALEDVTGEQDFGASGRVDKRTAAATGKMKGADYIVKPTIIEWVPDKDSHEIGMSAGAMGARALGIGSVGLSGHVAFCRIAIKIIDATTGEIVQQMTCDGTAKTTGFSIGGGMLGFMGNSLAGGALGMASKKSAPMSAAMAAAVNKAAYWVAKKLEEKPWQGSIGQITAKGSLVINAGANIGLTKGMTLTLMSKGEPFQDPDDPSVTLYATEELGTGRITSVQPSVSIVEVVTGGKGVKVGDIVRLEPAAK